MPQLKIQHVATKIPRASTKKKIPHAAAKKKIPHAATKKILGTFQVAQWLRICLPMQGTQVHALVREDPTCRGATKPVCHNY